MLNPATARAAAASLDLDKATKGPLSGLRVDKVRLTATPLSIRRSLCRLLRERACAFGGR